MHTQGLGRMNTSYFHTRKLYYNLGRQIKTSSFFGEEPKISSSNSHSSVSSNSSINIPCDIEDEFVETESKTEFEASDGGHVDSNKEAYLDEPIADEAC